MSDCYTNVNISRFELYPSPTPTGYCVGFTATCEPNKRTNYWDTLVTLADASGQTDTQIANLAYATLSGSIVPWATGEMEKSTIIGTLETTISGSA